MRLLGIHHALSLALTLIFLTTGFSQDRPEKYSQFNRAQSLNRDVSFQQPSEFASGKSSTRVELLVQESINLLDGDELRHRCYNGGLVGPTIRVKPGQNLHVKVRNILPPTSSSHSNEGPHGFNVTNLHTHGLHVSPKCPADDVFKQIRPGESFDYTFEIPENHHAGTFWYHAHKHGSTAIQLASGMAGALIVEGGLDHAPVVKDAEEKILVLQQSTVTKPDGEPGYIDPDSIYKEKGNPSFVQAINGVVTPTIVMRPGEIQRWRIIHAGTTEAIELDIEGINFHEIAVDGLATGRIATKNRLTLYPGYRLDVLVQAPDIAVERLMTSMISDPQKSIRGTATERSSLLRVVVAGDPKPMKMPTESQLEPYAAFTQNDVPESFANTREIEFSSSGNTKFYINGKQFDPTTTEQTIELNTSEEWEISSESGVHPFHIHVNPFATRRKGSNDPWVWRDTIAVFRGRPMMLRTTYKSFAGKTVLHCHNLRHEDLGMMQAIEIVDSNAPGTETSAENARLESGSQLEAPDWTAVAIDGSTLSSSDFKSKSLLIVFHRGMNCIHCAQQMLVLNKNRRRLSSAGIEVVAISQFLPDEKEALETLSNLGFPVLVDNELQSFRQFNCIADDGVPNHGLFLLNSENRIVFKEQTKVAVTDPGQLIDRIIKFKSLDSKGM